MGRDQSIERWGQRYIEEMSDLVLVVDLDGDTIASVNERGAAAIGWAAIELVGQPITEALHRDDWALWLTTATSAIGSEHQVYRQRWLHRSGHWLVFDAFTGSLEAGQLVVCARNITPLLEAENARRDLLRLVEMSGDPLLISDDEGLLEFANQTALRYYTSVSETPVGAPVAEFVSPDGTAAHGRLISDALKNGNRASRLIPMVTIDGRRIELMVRTERDASTGRWYTVQHDVTEAIEREARLEQLNAELRHAATVDHLTGLANRAVLFDELSDALARRHRFALLLLDVDNFKLINDTLGHVFGDKLLRCIAERLEHRTSADDLVARFGGDEFLVMLRSAGDERAALRAAEDIRKHVQGPYVVDGRVIYSSCSVGVALAEPEVSTAGDLIRNADTAAYEAKDLGRNTSVLYDRRLRIEVQRRFELESDLRIAIDDGQIDVALQGIYDAESRELLGFESLARWKHPERGPVAPVEFIDVAEDCGLLDDITLAVLTKSLDYAASWLHRSQRTLAVNFAPSQLVAVDLPNRLFSILDLFDVEPRNVVIEITEVGLTGALAAATPNLLLLRNAGFHLAIDDFGKGASSLGYLRDVPVDVVKIDGSFVHELATDDFAATITSSVIELADRLGLSAVAECVETEDQLAILTGMGCQRVQGYLLHRPSPIDEIEVLQGPVPDQEPAGSTVTRT